MRPQPKIRRALFNWDGDDLMAMAHAPMSREMYTSLAFDPLTDSTVDAVLWCSAGGNEAAYRSEVLELMGENFDFKFPDYEQWRRYANAKSLMDSGDDQLEIACAEARQRGIDPFFSLRMNDIHDRHWDPEILSRVKKDNPDWLLRDKMPEYYSALNYAQPGLRDLRRRQIAELFEKYDFDGIELDWLRHSAHLELDAEYRLRYTLTDFIRDIRATLDAIGEKRGRYYELLVRVPETVDAAVREGYDVAAWLGEDLLDGVVLGQGHCIPTDYAAWRDLMTQRRVPLYPCVYGYGSGFEPYPDEAVYGLSASFLDAGADGVYTFNWYPYGDYRKELLATFADAEALPGRSKIYHAEERLVETYTRGNRVYSALTVELWPTCRDSGPEVPIYCADDFAAHPPASLQLAVNLKNFGPQDNVEVLLNGKDLDEGALEPGEPHPSYYWGGSPTFRSLTSWLKFDLQPEQLVKGVNVVTVILRERNPDLTGNIVLERVELTVNY